MKKELYSICEKEDSSWKPVALCGTLAAAKRICVALQHAYPGCCSAVLRRDRVLLEYPPISLSPAEDQMR